jgi:hypothetical protein
MIERARDVSEGRGKNGRTDSKVEWHCVGREKREKEVCCRGGEPSESEPLAGVAI